MATRTRSATLRPCDFDIAEVTSRLTTPSLSIASSWESPRFLSSMMATSFSTPSSGTAIAAQRLRVTSWIVASMSSGEWLRPYTIKRSLMRPMMNSSPSEKKPKSPVRSHGFSGVPADASDKRCAERTAHSLQVSANSR